MRLSGTSHRENVRLQETGEEEDQEEERGVDGAQREADPGEGQQQIRGERREPGWGGGTVASAVESPDHPSSR